MAAALFAGGAVGVLCTELSSAVKIAVVTIATFHDRFLSIESALETLIPILEQTETLNDQLDIPPKELRQLHELLKGGKVLIGKCSKVKKWNVVNKHKYSGKLRELDNKLTRFCNRDLPLINTRNSAAVLFNVNQLHNKLDRLGEEKDVASSRITEFKSCNVPQGPDFVVGLDDLFEEIKQELHNGIVPVHIIFGAPGYGKTTLVKKLCNDDTIAGRYKDNIIFIVVSESPNLMTIVRKIAKHFRKAVPETASEDDAIRQLQELLAEKAEQNPILLILDDIWSSSKSLLEKFVFKHIKNYKVLATSRCEFKEIGSSHKLEGLKHENAVKLLSHAAKPMFGQHMLPDEEVIDEVVKKCKGSPLALTVIGKSLRGKDESAWKSKLNEWSCCGVSLIDHDEILKCLMNSLNDLDCSNELRRIKQFFLDLGSFPEDHKILVTVLIDMCSELHGIDGNGVFIVAAIKELCDRSLADLTVKRKDVSVGDGYYNDMYVTQHDLLRDLAIHYNNQGALEERERINLNIRKNNLPEWFPKEQDQPLKLKAARLMSICTDEEFSSAWPDLELPKVEVLVLNFRAKENKYALPDLIKKMGKLKTLIITNNGSLPAELSNFDLIACLSELKKIRLEHVKITCHNIADLCFSKLEKVSTFHCEISEEIQTSEVQFHTVFPALVEVDISYCGNLKTLPKGICEAKTLKKVSVTNCHKLSQLPENIGNLSELEMLRLNSCTSLETLPSSIQGLKNLRFLDISNCTIIQTLPKEIGELQLLKEFHLSFCPKLSKLPSSVVGLQKLGYLIVDEEQQKNLLKLKMKLKLKLKLLVAVQDMSLNFLG